jgi:hypothetical protein
MHTQRFLGLAAAVILAISAISVTEVAAQGGAVGSGVNVPVTGSGSGATFAGVLNIQRFARSGSQIFAVGTITGVLTTTDSARNVIRQVRVPLDRAASGPGEVSIAAVCQILSLVLGPLNLDLLGLVIDLDQVVLNIDAVSGAGNLLGNLLCAVTGLLDGVGVTQLLTNLLNQILAILG